MYVNVSKYKSILFHQIYLFIRTSRITEYENEVEVCKGKYKSLILEMINMYKYITCLLFHTLNVLHSTTIQL